MPLIALAKNGVISCSSAENLFAYPKYLLGTRQGYLPHKYTCTQIMPCAESLLSMADVPDGKELALHKVASPEANGSEQDFFKCNRVINNVQCNSKRHSFT